MPAFGARHPYFAKFAAEEKEDQAPTYTGGVKISNLVSANLTINTINGQYYADDAIIEDVTEFVSGSIPMETNDIPDDIVAIIYGASVTGDEVAYGTNDQPPYGGLAYIKTLISKSKIIFRGYFYPKVKAALGNDNAQSKSGSISFQNTTTNFTVFDPLHPDTKWRYTKTFEGETAETDALAWIKSKLNITEEQPSPEG